MKLIDLLVKDLPKSGGWPSEAVTAIYFSHKKGVTFYDNDGMGIKNGVSFICMDIPGVRREEVTKEEFESALAASEGWIEWGGACPTDGVVDVKLRNGHITTNRMADSLDWNHYTPDGEGAIIAYRLHKPDINSRANDDRLEQDLKEIGVSGKYLDDIMNIPLRIDRLERDLNECIGQGGDMPCEDGVFPPTGSEVEYSTYGQKAWYRGIVTASGESMCIVKNISGAEQAFHKFDIEFRSLLTEAEKAREETLMCMSHSLRANGSVTAEQLNRLYSDIASGVITGIKLEAK